MIRWLISTVLFPFSLFRCDRGFWAELSRITTQIKIIILSTIHFLNFSIFMILCTNFLFSSNNHHYHQLHRFKIFLFQHFLCIFSVIIDLSDFFQIFISHFSISHCTTHISNIDFIPFSIDFDFSLLPQLKPFKWTFQYHFEALLLCKKNHTQFYFYMRKDQKKTRGGKAAHVWLLWVTTGDSERHKKRQRRGENVVRRNAQQKKRESGVITCYAQKITRFPSRCKQTLEILSHEARWRA